MSDTDKLIEEARAGNKFFREELELFDAPVLIDRLVDALVREREHRQRERDELQDALNTAVYAALDAERETERKDEALQLQREALEQIAGPTPTSHRKTDDQLTDAVKWRRGMARDAIVKSDAALAPVPATETDGK
ncbi:MAG: hypothetical protein M3540_12300 [Actinomycetota bacterium]|nr:hypothetical protein [Actinomycetota bacterium]